MSASLPFTINRLLFTDGVSFVLKTVNGEPKMAIDQREIA